jgi:hypothetical protein
MALLVIILFIGSAVAGWMTFYPWLLVPPAVFATYAWAMQRRALEHARRNGMSGEFYKQQMLGPNVKLVVWNAVLHGLIFAGFHFVHGIV